MRTDQIRIVARNTLGQRFFVHADAQGSAMDVPQQALRLEGEELAKFLIHNSVPWFIAGMIDEFDRLDPEKED